MAYPLQDRERTASRAASRPSGPQAGAFSRGAVPEDVLHFFIPAHLAAVCADCHGYFLLAVGRCPGCGSQQYALAEVEPKPMEDAAE